MVRFVNGVPQALYLSAHSGGAAYTFNAMPKQNGRPITYIATGTHANYATPGDHEHDLPGLIDHTDAGTLWDVTKNFRGFWFDNSTQTFSLASGAAQGATEEASGEGVGWLQFGGKWGDKQYELLHRGQYCVGIPDVATECKLVDGPTGTAMSPFPFAVLDVWLTYFLLWFQDQLRKILDATLCVRTRTVAL